MEKTTTPAAEAFRKGTDARAQGLQLAENPFDLQTEEHREWRAGWSATFDLDEDRDPASTRVDEDEAPGSMMSDAPPGR